MSSSKPKILICTGIFPPDIGGPASYAKTLASKLHEHGIGVGVISYSKSFNVKKFDKELPFPVIRVWGGWPIWIKHLSFGIKLLFNFPRYDTVFALNVWSAGFPAWIANRLYRKRYIIRIVGDYAWEVAVGKGKTSLLLEDFQKSKKMGWIKNLHSLQTRVCKSADAVIVPSEYLAGIVEGWGISRDKIHVVYNAVDFKPSELTKEEARKKLGVSGNIILSVGRLVPWKGFQMLIKMMPKLTEINSFFKLVIVGDGPERDKLKSIVRNLNLDRKVVLAGRKSQSELADYMAASDIFVLNTGYEGFSHTIIEAMAAGLPVITTNAGGNVEVIKQGENGLMVKYNDEFNIIEAVRAVWNNPELRDKFIAEGRGTAGDYTVNRMVGETLKVLLP